MNKRIENTDPDDRTILVVAEVRLVVNVDAYNREYGESNSVAQVRREVKAMVEEGVRDSILRHLDHAISVEYNSI
jgi:hypothetical protein